MDEIIDNTLSEPATEETHTRREQDQKISNLIEEAGTLIAALQADSFVAEKLVGMGYDEARFQAGLDLRKILSQKFSARAEAIGIKRQAAAELMTREEKARSDYAAFRLIARTLFKSDSARSTLSIQGRVLKDRQKFIAEARTAYVNAALEPFLSELADYGYPSETISKLVTGLDEIITADKAQNAIINTAITATAERDTAANELREWIRRLRNVVKVVLKDHPKLLQILST